MQVEKYRVKFTLLENMLGTVAKDKDIYTKFIESKKPVEVTDEALEAETVGEERPGWTGFHEDENGLFIYDYMIKGFLKNAANILKDELKVKNLRSKINNYVFVFPRRIPLGKTAPDGTYERPLRGQTAQGPIVTLAKSDVVHAGTTFEVEIHVLQQKEISQKVIEECLAYGQYQGIGQFRNGSWGRVACEIEKIK